MLQLGKSTQNPAALEITASNVKVIDEQAIVTECAVGNTEKKKQYIRAVFNRVSKVIHDCFNFSYLCSVIDSENSRQAINRDLICHTRFPGFFMQFFYFYFEFSLANDDVHLRSYWLLWLLWFWFYETQLKTAPVDYILLGREYILFFVINT